MTQLVDPNHLSRANGLLSVAGSLAAILGPAFAGVIVIAVGPGWAIGVDAISYAASALCIALVRPQFEPLRTATTHPILRDFIDGLNAFSSRRWLWLIIIQFGLLNLVALAPFMVLAPVLLAKLPNGSQAWGLLLSANGLGGVIGGAAIIRWYPTRSILVIELAAALLALPLILIALHAPLPLILAGGSLYGIGMSLLNVIISTLVQHEIPRDVQSRVFSIVQIVAGIFIPAGSILAGPVAAWFGPDQALAIGAGVVLLSVATLICFEDVRHFAGSNTKLRLGPVSS